MNRKKSLLGLVFGALLYYIIPFVSAYGFGSGFIDLKQGGYQLIQWTQDFTTPFFEVLLNTSSGDFFFAKSLMLLLLFMIIFFVLEKSEMFGNKRGLIFIIAAIVSILGMRYLPESDFILGILLPYNTLGVAILTLLPFLIYFFFVHKSVPGHFGRRAAWAVYGIIFLVLWAFRSEEMSEISNWIYIISLALVGLSFIFDTSLHQYFSLSDYRKFRKESTFWGKIELKEKMGKLKRALEQGMISERDYEHENKILDERYKEINK